MKNYTIKVIYILIFVLMFFSVAGLAKANYDYDHDDCSNPLNNGSNCVPPASLCQINNFSYSYDSATFSNGVILNWVTTNCTDVIISNITGTIPVSGTKLIWPTTTTAYTLIAYGNNSPIQTKKLTIDIAPNPIMTGIINAANTTCQIIKGASTCPISFSWSTQNPIGTSAVTHDGLTLATGNSGTRSFEIPYGVQTYFLYNNSENLATRMVSASCAPGTIWNNSICQTEVINNCLINSFTTNQNSISRGDDATLSWQTSNCASVTISNLNYNLPFTGSQTIWPTRTTTYTLTARNINGQSQTRALTIYVDQQSDCQINDFTASDTRLSSGESTTLRWSTDNCSSVKISNIGYVSADGNRRIYPDSNTTYLLTAYDSDGSRISDSVRIYVDDNNCEIDSFTTNKNNITSGQAVTLRWQTTDCDQVEISNIGSVSGDGSQTIYPRQTTIYTLSAEGQDSNYRSIQINVNYSTAYVAAPIYNSQVITTVATNVTTQAAQLNGLLTVGNRAETYFNYGPTLAMEFRTTGQVINGNTYFSESLINLDPKTIYFFQAVTNGSNGLSRGAVEVFETKGLAVANDFIEPKVVIQGTTLTTESPIMLRLENKYEAISLDEMIDYTLTYKNIGKTKLKAPLIQVILPKGIALTNYSLGSYEIDSRTLSIPLADLDQAQGGIIYLQAKVEKLDTGLAKIVTTAILIYTNQNGAQENAMAYALNSPKNTNGLGAMALTSQVFHLNLIGWLLIIIFILLLVLVARTFYSRRVNQNHI